MRSQRLWGNDVILDCQEWLTLAAPAAFCPFNRVGLCCHLLFLVLTSRGILVSSLSRLIELVPASEGVGQQNSVCLISYSDVSAIIVFSFTFSCLVHWGNTSVCFLDTTSFYFNVCTVKYEAWVGSCLAEFSINLPTPLQPTTLIYLYI